MTDPLVLVVLLGTKPDPTSDAVLAATRRALGGEAIVLADTSEPSTDRDAVAVAERVHARAVARITWSPGNTAARLHVHVGRDEGSKDDVWVDDEMRFAPEDAPNERGRTVGYAVASMVQRLEQAHAPAVPVVVPPPPRAVVVPLAVRHDVDLRVTGIGAIGGAASAGGGALGARLWLRPAVGVSATVGLRGGHVGTADATTTTPFLAVGPAVRRALTSTTSVGLRADFVLLRPAMHRAPEGGVAITRDRWLGAADVVAELDVALTGAIALVVGAGTEVAFGPTPVHVGAAEVANFPVFRAVVELGGRIRF